MGAYRSERPAFTEPANLGARVRFARSERVVCWFALGRRLRRAAKRGRGIGSAVNEAWVLSAHRAYVKEESRSAIFAPLSLTCPYTGVYIAALPGKKGGGCLSDQAG